MFQPLKRPLFSLPPPELNIFLMSRMSTFANGLTHPLLEKLDNTEVKEVKAEPGCSPATDKHVNLSFGMKIVFLNLFSSSNRAHVGRLALCLCHELG